MDEIGQYRKYGDECRSLAATAKDPEQQKRLLEMAMAWETVAGQKTTELAATTDQ